MAERIRKHAGLLLCFCYGALVPLGFAPFGYYIVPVISVALLLHAWLRYTPKKTFLSGYLFGLGMYGTGVSWLHISINLFGGMNLIGSYLITLLLVLYLACYPAVAGYLMRRWLFVSKPVFLLLSAPAMWVLGEWGRSRIFTGFPWLNLGYSQIDSPLAGLAPITGIYGVSWAAVLSAGLLVLMFHCRRRGKILVFIAAVLLWTGTGQLYPKHWTQPSGTISVALIQGGIPQRLKWKPELRQQSFDLYLELTRPHQHSDLIVWPETAIPALYQQAPGLADQLHGMTRVNGNNLVSGIPFRDPETGVYYNSAVLFNGGVNFYHKRHLVPFGEYLPLAGLFQPLLHRLGIPVSNFTAGTQPKPLLRGPRFGIGISICYEDTFGEEVIESLPEAGILVNISNDAWFGDSLAPHQHLEMARMRARETGRYLLRATNTGITAIIDEHGWITHRSTQFKPQALAAEVLLFEGSTPYAGLGNMPVLLAALMILAGIILLIKIKTARQATGPEANRS
jgi:apolipoprotein N-acyltransferase